MVDDVFLIEIDAEKALKWFGDLIARSDDLTSINKDIGEILLESTQKRFETGLDPEGIPWVPLADGSGRTPLTDTGRMRQDIFPSHGKDFVEISAVAKQARWMQEGVDPFVIEPRAKRARDFRDDAPLGNHYHPGIPARPFIGLSAADEEVISNLAVAWLDLDALGGG
jgi:phage gpG-like protein